MNGEAEGGKGLQRQMTGEAGTVLAEKMAGSKAKTGISIAHLVRHMGCGNIREVSRGIWHNWRYTQRSSRSHQREGPVLNFGLRSLTTLSGIRWAQRMKRDHSNLGRLSSFMMTGESGHLLKG